MTNLFFAIELSDEARDAVDGFAANWRSMLGDRGDIRWYASRDYHVTLKFLGPRTAGEEERFAEAGRAAATRIADRLAGQGITIRSAGAGAFPNLGHPRVLWAGAVAAPELRSLAAAMESECALLGAPTESRSFRPHITLARCVGGAIEAPKPSGASRVFSPFRVSRFVLMRTSDPASRKTESFIRYNTVRTFDI
jgi:2'-5' RNA ligase